MVNANRQRPLCEIWREEQKSVMDFGEVMRNI